MLAKLFNTTLVKTYLIFQLITRISLSIYSLWHHQVSIEELPVVFLAGLLNDLISLCYFVPIISILTLILHKFLVRYEIPYLTIRFLSYFLLILILLINSISEFIFWDEFGTRFNFIAVDYLIYTNEIIGTLKESLPFQEIIIGLFVCSAIITFVSRKNLLRQSENLKIKNHFIYISTLFILSLIIFNFSNGKRINFSSNRYGQDLGKNGFFEFFSAFYNNTLDYNKLYSVIDRNNALQIVRNSIKQDNQKFLNEDSIDRLITPSQRAKKYNVMLLTVESLSAEFMGKFGNTQNITPYLDKLSEDSIFFTNFYAVGTRTVRGLEAITLSVPPTPGSSIIRRPNNQSLFNIGSVFKKEGYDVNFIFGGYSYFDNLQNYFSNNLYNVIDRGNLKSNEISFANIWGVADEDILLKSIEAANQSYKEGRNFFSLIMTTSNHRPYTFPSNRIDLLSGGGRNAAVKYTDYAIGKFIEEARKQPWFDNTIFVISADHCSSSAGKTDLPVHKYHIPLIIYAPKIFKGEKIEKLASQIDIAPTILGLLNFEYKSKFFGQDILKLSEERAFIGTYQLLGFIKEGHLVILRPNADPKTYKLVKGEKEEVENIPHLIEEAISFYQTGYNDYIENKMQDFQ